MGSPLSFRAAFRPKMNPLILVLVSGILSLPFPFITSFPSHPVLQLVAPFQNNPPWWPTNKRQSRDDLRVPCLFSPSPSDTLPLRNGNRCCSNVNGRRVSTCSLNTQLYSMDRENHFSLFLYSCFIISSVGVICNFLWAVHERTHFHFPNQDP
jgi:hypothetical protein